MSNTGIFRKKKVYFTQVSNNILDDAMNNNIVSRHSFFIYTIIQKYITIEDFTLSKSFVMKKSGMSEKTFEKYFKELRNAGYLKSYQYPAENGRLQVEYDLLDVAEPNTPTHTVYNAKGEIVQKYMPKDAEKLLENEEKKKKEKNKKVSKKVFLEKVAKQDNEPVEKELKKEITTPPIFNGVENLPPAKVGELNNTILNNTNYNNTNINLSIYNKTYCSLEKKEVVDRKIEDLVEYTTGGFSRWDYRKFLNAACGDIDLIKYVYDTVLDHMKNEDSRPIKNMVMYLVKAIEKELKTLVKNN